MSQLIDNARALVRNTYGTAVADKASDAFCLSLIPSQLPGIETFGSEAMVAKPAGLVIEFHTKPTRNDANEALRASNEWQKLKKALVAVKSSEVIGLQAEQIIRQRRIITNRESFLKLANVVTSQVERQLVRLYASRNVALQNHSTLTQTCWLNQTVRTVADASAMSEVASDPSIKSLDLPRQLEKEIIDSVPKIGASAYRKKFGRTGKGIIIAIIDSEIALGHPALKDRVIQRRNYTQEPWGTPDFHGTAVAGIIGSNNKKFTGMAPKATLYNYKVLATNRELNGDDFHASLAIQQALEDGAHIANCSWGAGPATDGTGREARACDRAWQLGLTIVKSAGNKGPGDHTLTAPADAEGIIVVAATDKAGTSIPSYSSRGPLSSGKPGILIAAPGGLPENGIISCQTNGDFGPSGWGTSYAAPHITGLLALLLEGDLDLSPDELRNLLISIGTPIPGFGPADQGVGLVSMNLLNP